MGREISGQRQAARGSGCEVGGAGAASQGRGGWSHQTAELKGIGVAREVDKAGDFPVPDARHLESAAQ